MAVQDFGAAAASSLVAPPHGIVAGSITLN
jgi:hypothetical protein